MAAETQYTVNTGMVKISGANTSLTGSGTLGTDIWDLITAGSNGTIIKTLNFKATGASMQGMIRVFVYDGTNSRLLLEVEVTTQTPTSNNPSFETTIPIDFKLKSGYKLRVTTQINNNFNVIAEGLDWAYYTTSVRPESTNYQANTGIGLAYQANPNLDGSGSLATVLTAGTSASGWKGCCIESINIKAISSTQTRGMVRIFIQNSSGTAASNTFLYREVVVPNGENPSGTFKSFEFNIPFPDKLFLNCGYKIIASTEIAEDYSVIAEGMDFNYPA